MKSESGWYQLSHLSCLGGNDGVSPLHQPAWSHLILSYTSPADAGLVRVCSPPVLVCCSYVSEAGTCSLDSLSCAAAEASQPPR